MKAAYDWTNFKKKIFIHAGPENVFEAWTKPGEIVKWFIAQAEYTTPRGGTRAGDETVQVGDRYHWRWHQKLDMHGEVLKVEDRSKFQFTFGEKVPGSAEKILVTVQISQSGPDTTLLELTQENMADTPEAHSGWHLSCNLGWSFFMTNLKALLEHGIDLREHSQERAALSRAVTHPV
jgi:uncharacterized protein YndB with AHSA1/START domain